VYLDAKDRLEPRKGRQVVLPLLRLVTLLKGAEEVEDASLCVLRTHRCDTNGVPKGLKGRLAVGAELQQPAQRMEMARFVFAIAESELRLRQDAIRENLR
jgi:hypothetical protein